MKPNPKITKKTEEFTITNTGYGITHTVNINYEHKTIAVYEDLVKDTPISSCTFNGADRALRRAYAHVEAVMVAYQKLGIPLTENFSTERVTLPDISYLSTN